MRPGYRRYGAAMALLLGSWIIPQTAPASPPKAAPDQSQNSGRLNDIFGWDISANGRNGAYVRRPVGGSGARLEAWADNGEQKATLGLDMPPGQRPESIKPVWDAAGNQLAFFFPIDGAWRLHIWRSEDNTFVVDKSRVACAVSGRSCRVNDIIWSHDSQSIVYLAEPQEKEAVETAPHRHAAPGESNKSNAKNVIVLRNRPDQSRKRGQTASGAAPADIVRFDIRQRKTSTLLEHAQVQRIKPSPDGRSLAALLSVSRERTRRQIYQDLILIDTSAADLKTKSGVRHLATNIPQMGADIAWSPDSKRIGYFTNGDLADGDIYILEVRTGEKKNLSADLNLPLYPKIMIGDYGKARLRFGGSAKLVWSADGERLYATRIEEDRRGNWRKHLWEIGINGRGRDITPSGVVQAELPIPERGVQHVSHDGLIVPVEYEDGRTALLQQDLKRRKWRIVAEHDGLPLSPYADIFTEETSGTLVYFVSRTSASAGEIVSVNLQSGSERRLTAINDNVPRAPWAVRHVNWNSASGVRRRGVLLLPHSTDATRFPLIVQIYPNGPFDSSPFRNRPYYLTTEGLVLAPLEQMLQEGYGLFFPDVVVAGGGYSCKGVANDIERAIAALKSIPETDLKRAAIVGHSFGGWAVTCVIGHTDIFRAAVSIAAPSNLISTSFSHVGSAASWGLLGGQARIGKPIWEAINDYWSESPISLARTVNTPLLLIHGREDTQAPVAQSYEMFTALSMLDKDVEFIDYPEATHRSVLTHPDTALRIQTWIEKYLGEK